LTQAEGQLLRDEALLQNARLDLDRYQKLLSQKSIAKQLVDTQDSLVRQYQGTVKLDKGAVDNARLQFTYSRITAPVTGRVGLRLVDLGNIVHASDANGIVVITQVQPINVVFAIPEVSLSQVLQANTANKQLKVEAWDRDNRNKIADGTLLAIDNQLNTSTGTINIKAQFANGNQQLFPNQFVNVHLLLGAQQDAITVPTVAVQLGKVGSYVYTVNEDQTVSLSKVKIGASSGDKSIIEEGLTPGQKVVIDGLDKLRDGAKVKVIDRAAQASAAAEKESKPHKKRDASSSAEGRNKGNASATN
jgi:multidrug efflux system membrane fusion protein